MILVNTYNNSKINYYSNIRLRILSMEYLQMLCITISITRSNVRCDGQTMFVEIFQNYSFVS